MSSFSDFQRTFLGAVLAALSAACLVLSVTPYGLCSLVWIGFIPMLLAQYRVLPPRLSALAPSIAIGGWIGWLSLIGMILFSLPLRWWSA